MKPREHEALTEPDPQRGRRVFGQTIYVTALERRTHDRTHARPTRVESPLPERIEVKIRPQEKYRGRLRYSRSRSIPELCRITLTPTGDEGLNREFDDEVFNLQEPEAKELGAERKEVYISQYTHCFEGKIAKPHIAAWKQDFEPCHVAHSDSKFCVLNVPVGSKSRDRPERPKSAPPGSFLFDFEKMDIPEPLSRRSTSPGMFIGDWMGIDETDYAVDDDNPTIVRPQAEETVTAQSVVPYESLSSSLWDDAFDGIEKESRDDVTQDPMQQARSLISELRSSVKTPDDFRKTYPQPVHAPQAMNATPEKEFQEYSPRSKAPPEKASQGSLPRIKPKPKRVSQEFSPWIETEVPEVGKHSESTNAERRPEKTTPTTPKETKDTRKGKKEKGLDERLRDLIGDLEPNDRASAFKIPQVTQEIKINHDPSPASTDSWKAVEVMTSPVSSPSGARTDQPDGRVLGEKDVKVIRSTASTTSQPRMDQSDSRVVGEKAAKFMTSPGSHTSRPRLDQSDNRAVGEKAAKFMTSPGSHTSQPRLDQSDNRVVGEKAKFMTSPWSHTSQPRLDQPDGKVVDEKPKRDVTTIKRKDFADVSKVQKPELEVMNRKSEDQITNRKKSKDEENSQPSDIYSKVTSLSNGSRTRNSSLSSEASYKRKLTSAWIEQQRLNIHRDTADSKELRLRRTKSADLQSEGFKIDEEISEVKLKHSKSEVSFEQLKAMYDPFGERDFTESSSKNKAKAVHTTKPTVITKARSVEHKLHKITYPKSPVELETLTKSGEEVLSNEAPLSKSEEPKILKFQAVYSENHPENVKFKIANNDKELNNDKKTTTEPQILPPKVTSQSGTSASPSIRIKAKHVVGGKEVVSSFNEDIPNKMASSVVSVTANEIEGAKYPVVQVSATRGTLPENKPRGTIPENKPRESGEVEINATQQKPSSNGGPHYVKVRSKETKNPVEKLTARFIKGKETTKVRHVATPTDRLDLDGNNNRPKNPGDTTPGSTPVGKKSAGKSAAGKRGAAFLSALKNVKIRRAKSEPNNLEKEAEDLKDGVKDGGEREEETTRVVVRGKGGHRHPYPLGSTPNLSPISNEEDEREAPNQLHTSAEHFEDTPQEKRPRKTPKIGLPALKISSMYPKFKKFTKKLRKSNQQHSSEEADVSESGNSGSFSIREILRSDQSTASFVSTGSEHMGTASEGQIDITENEEDVFAVESVPEINGGEISPPRIQNAAPFNGEKQQIKAKVTKVKIISRETAQAEEKKQRTDGFPPTISNSHRIYNNVEKQKTPTSAGNISTVRVVSGEIGPQVNTKSKDSIVSPVATSTREMQENNGQEKTKEAQNNTTVVLRDTQFHKEARKKHINRLSMPEMSSTNDEMMKQTKTDMQRRATVIGSAVDVSRISSTETPLTESQPNNDKKNGLVKAKVSTVNARTTSMTEDILDSQLPNTATENSKNEYEKAPKKISRKKAAEGVEKKEFGRKIKGFITKVLPFNHRGKISPGKELTGINNETREKADDTDKGRGRHFESVVIENTSREVLVDVTATPTEWYKVEARNQSETAKAVGCPLQESPKRKQGEVLKAKTYVLQPEVKVTSTAEEYEKLRKESVTGNETTVKCSSRVQHLPQLATVKTMVEREQASKFERTRKYSEKSFSVLAGNGEDDGVARSDDVARPRKLVAMVTVDPVTTTVVDHAKQERISKAQVSEDHESIDRAFDFLRSAFGDGANTREKTMATTAPATSTATTKQCMKQERITKAQVSEDLESVEVTFDFLSSALNENDTNTREKSRVEVMVKGERVEGERVIEGETRGYERTSGITDGHENRDFFTEKNEGAVREEARVLNSENKNDKKESADEKESSNQIKTFTTDKRDHAQLQKNSESGSSERTPTASGESHQNLYYGRIKGATIDEQRHQAIRVQTAPSPKSEHGKNPRSINLERATTRLKSTNFVESREEHENVNSRGSRRGVTAFLTNHDESGNKHHLQYVEKVTMTRSSVVSDVRREARGEKETGTIRPEDRSQVRSGDKFPGVKLEQSDFVGDGNNAKQRVNVGQSVKWSQTRSGDKSPGVKLERGDFLESANTKEQVNVGESAGWSQIRSGEKFLGGEKFPSGENSPGGEKSPGVRLEHSDFFEEVNTKEQVNVGGIEGWSQIRSGDKSPGMKLDWGNDGNDEGPGLGKDSRSSDSIKASSDDELLQLIEDQIASEESDEGDNRDKSDDGDTTPVPENNPEIYSTPRKTPEVMKNVDTEHKTTYVSQRSPNTPVGVVSSQKTEVDGKITPKIRTEYTMKARVDPTMKARVDPTMKARVDPTMKPRVDPTMKPRVDPTMKPRVAPTSDHADLPTNGHGSTGAIQKATFSFVDMSVEETSYSQINTREITHKKDYLFNYSSSSGRNSEVKQQTSGKTTTAKRSKHFTKKKKQTNNKSSEDLSTRLKRLLTDDSSGPDDSSLSLNQDVTSPIYSFSEDSEFDTQFFNNKATFSTTPTNQRQYRSLERPRRTAKNNRMSKSSQISPNEFSSDEEYYPNRSGFDFRSHSKTL